MDLPEREKLMSPRAPRSQTGPVTPEDSQRPTTPTGGAGSGDYSNFIWQQLSDIQRAVGSIQTSQAHLQASIERLDEKVDRKLSKVESDVGDLMKTHHATKWVLIVLLSLGGAGLGLMGWVMKEVWDLSKPLLVQKLTTPVPAAPPVLPAPATRP